MSQPPLQVSSHRDILTSAFEIDDFLEAAEAVLGTDMESLRTVTKTPSAESALAAPFFGIGDHLMYEHPVQRAAILASRIMRNHPLPDGNKRVALVLMRVYLPQNVWRLAATPKEIDVMFRAVAAREHSEDYFISWACRHTERLEPRPATV